MQLCIGAASRRVIEEAAKLGVYQIVASRRQVGETAPGYTGLTSASFAELVRKLSVERTQVVRDHGGPYQSGNPNDDWEFAFDADVAAGFDTLHIDVCKLPPNEQPVILTQLCQKYQDQARIEIGGERDSQEHLNMLMTCVLRVCQPKAAVADLGGHIWADRQYGALIPAQRARDLGSQYASAGVMIKAHNCDWIGGRRDYFLDGLYNVAPEFGNIEVDAWLRLLDYADAQDIMNWAYTTGDWTRWFNVGEGTTFERSRAALRYHLETPRVKGILEAYDDLYVRETIRDAILRG